MSREIKACPFCGSPAESHVCRDDDHNRYGEVHCTSCSASTRGEYLHWMDNTDAELASEFDAITAWNSRARDAIQ